MGTIRAVERSAVLPKPVSEFISGARAAQRTIADWPQKRVDAAVAAIAWHICRPETARELTGSAYSQTGIGSPEDAFVQLGRRVHGALSDFHGVQTLGLIEAEPERRLRRYAKPIGVIGVLTPATAPIAAITVNAMTAVKTRNAAVICANPGVRSAGAAAVEVIRQGLKAAGAPVDLVQFLTEPARSRAVELAEQCDMVIATGGAATVRRASAAGRPTYSGGPGNAVVIIDETADLTQAADAIVAGKTFDNGTSCSAESTLIVARAISGLMRAELTARGVHFCDAAEGARLRATVWPDGKLFRGAVGQPATRIAKLAGVEAPDGTRALAADIGADPESDPMCGEKLSPIMGFTTYGGFDEAVALVRRLTAIAGRGHSCGIHSSNASHVERLAEAAEVSRMMVNQSTGLGNSGSFGNGMPFTSTISCGSWGGSTLNENVTWRRFLNYTWVSEPLQRPAPSWETLMEPYLAIADATA
ncbi:aldehyde dehydrogenase family protein [Methylopila musalis]|uniref:Aldehyde dehydrogenase family protein n=1 Tax=Methylopila musalis TaxID=1134781 RepID=A0ABW3Z371_9HYPH